MRALVVDRSSDAGVRIGQAPEPRPAPDEAVVRISAFSVNPGDLAALAGLNEGSVPGWEAAGHVVRAAADGSGPEVGTAVTTFGYAGAWAEYRAVRTAMLGTAPADADLAAVSTVPVAASSALRALRELGAVLGRRVMITGATGGVGRYAIQLARLAGAEHIAVTSAAEERDEELRALGARSVVADPAAAALAFGVIDTVGGDLLVRAFDRLDDRGVLVALGNLDTGGSRFTHGALMATPDRNRRTIVSFHQFDGTPLAPDFTWLSHRLADGTLRPSLAWRGPWSRADEAIGEMSRGRVRGKVVMEIA